MKKLPPALGFLTVRQQQALAALCLAQFCSSHGLSHPAITSLIMHLLSILVAESLPDWEGNGAKLDITGRGYPLPASVVACIPKDLLNDFDALTQLVVEVGIADMYATPSNEPVHCLRSSMDILRTHGLPIPESDEVFGKCSNVQGDSHWGAPVNSIEYEKVLLQYRIIQSVRPAS